MSKINIFSTLIFLISTTIISCSSSENLEPVKPLNNVTYNASIKTIIDSNCINCHSTSPTNGAPMSLTTYNDVKNAVESLGLIDRIEDGSMPPNGELKTKEIQLIKDWKINNFKK